MKKTIESLVKKLGEDFKKHRITLVTSESCTGGGLAYHIVKDPACSSILERGYITYSNQAKQEVLLVTADTIQIFGAVSKEVVQQMAEGALKKSNAQVSISISGIAGEDCASDKSKGTLWLGCAGIDKKSAAAMHIISGERNKFVDEAILRALKFLLEFINSPD